MEEKDIITKNKAEEEIDFIGHCPKFCVNDN